MTNSQNREPVQRVQSHEPSTGDVRQTLELVLSDQSFAQSVRMGRFLRYIVEETLAGKAEWLKEYSIAIEVFDRDVTFDPQTSSLVRVEAGRLRTKLNEYYQSGGANDPIIIELPRGAYVPNFLTRDVGSRESDISAPVEGILKFARSPVFRLLLITIVSFTIAAVATSKWLLQPVRDSAPATSIKQPSVAVLPLHNLSGDPGQEYLADGMTDAIINRLARSHQLRVVSFTSVMLLKKSSASVGEIGNQLGVQHVIEGSLTRSGDRVRISAKLIDTGSNQHIWVETFERPASDVLEMQDDVARKIKEALFGRLVARENEELKPVPPVTPEAYEAYLRGQFFTNQISADGFRKAIVYFQQAISLAPSFAPAHADLAACYCLLGGHGFEIIHPNIGMPEAKRAAEEALRLDDTLAEPYAYLGIVRLKYDWDWAGAERALKRAIELKPNFYRARLFYSFYLEAMGRTAEAINQADLARINNPLSREVIVNLGWQYMQAGMVERARTQFENALELEPSFWGAHWGLGHLFRRQGALEKSIAAFKAAVATNEGHAVPLSALGHAYAVAGRHSEATEVLEKLRSIERTTYVSPFHMATIHVGLGETDKAFEQLGRAYADKSRSLVWLNVMPEYDSVRREPKFLELIGKIGLPR